MNSALKCRCVQTSSRLKPSVDQFSQLTTSHNQPPNLHILGGNLWEVPLYFLLCLSNDVFNPSQFISWGNHYLLRKGHWKYLTVTVLSKPPTTYNATIVKYTGTKWGKIKWILCSCWLIEPARLAYLDPAGFSTWLQAKNFCQHKLFINQAYSDSI